MLCRTNDGKSFTLNPYLDETTKTRMGQRRRYYFKHGILEVKRHPLAKSLFVLRYKGDYVTSWSGGDAEIVAHDLIAAVCRTLDAVLGVDKLYD